MAKKIFPPILLYLCTVMAVLCWWYIAFISPGSSPAQPYFQPLSKPQHRIPAPQYLSYLSPLKRNLIREALSGDISLMTKMMSEWDVDAQILENHGLIGVKRLSRHGFIKAQMIGRQLKKVSGKELAQLRREYCSKEIQDDCGQLFKLDTPLQRYLPQTYISATFLFALTEPENIVAIPHGFREQTRLYPTSLTNRVHLDIDRYNSEEIYQSKPDIAFVAHYSLPSTLQALRNQGIPLFTLRSINNLPEISDAINRIGHVINRPQEAELLTLFMESAMLAIDNHLLAMSHAMTEQHGSPKIMFLNYHTNYSLPTRKTIAGQLLDRLGTNHNFTFVSLLKDPYDEWMIPVEQETIVRCNPDCLIISSSNSEALKNQVNKSPSFAQLSANKQNRIYFVDETVFESPTQYIVLAYLDLAKVLVDATSPYSR